MLVVTYLCDGPPRTTGKTCRAYASADINGKRPKGWTRRPDGTFRCPSCTRDSR